MEILEPGLPYGFAKELLRRLKKQGKAQRKIEILKRLKKCPGLHTQNYRWEYVNGENKAFIKGLAQNEGEFLERVEGRQLSEVDLQKLAQEMKLKLHEVTVMCERQVRKGLGKWIPALQRFEKSGWQCVRCGETQLEEWLSIYGLAATCPACKALGALSSLQVIFRCDKKDELREIQNEDMKKVVGISFRPHFVLSEAQKQASEEIYSFVASRSELSERKEVLLWAACGAGKTEVCFPAASYALGKGLKVLFAAPRQDVVLDVAPRIERDFPGLPLSVLTGVTQERFFPAPFVIATTHQVLRFFQAFDLIFLDEIDAFPYYGNRALTWGLRQALKPFGKIIYLTATPSEENLKRVSKGQMQLVRLPARHHGNPVPVPEWIRFPKSFSKDSVDSLVKESLLIEKVRELVMAGPLIVFVPKISWVDLWVKGLKNIFPHYNISGSYSSDPKRKEEIEKLKRGQYNIFISTSILERGVTIPNAQVIVLAADHEVFNERALVQMAGRVGRTSENPKGRALFLANSKTKGIEKAIHWIEDQNKYALKNGLIKKL